MPEDPSNPTPQFETAEYAGVTKVDHCAFCNQPIGDRYYRINNAMSCASCADTVQRRIPEGHGAYLRALLFGIGAAIAGLILYATFSIVTGWVIGYLSLAVGYMVGKAMMKGSGGLGGRKYQITAILLTYAAVSMAAIPVAIHQSTENKETAAHTEQKAAEGTEPQQAQHEANATMSFGAALGYLTLLGLASPFLEMQDPMHGIIGLIILLVGIQIAWKTTAGRSILIRGPYDQPATPQS